MKIKEQKINGLVEILIKHRSLVIKEIKENLPNLKDHICLYNDGECECECYKGALEEVKKILNSL